jgi:xanthine/CO dehydrogenase XdhC/CoxF family maturation factor
VSNETRDVLRAWRSLEGGGRPVLLATLVRTAGSSYRRAGARLLMTEDRWIAGGISGGCLEGDLLRKAWWRTADCPVASLEYDSTDEDDSLAFSLGCRGKLSLLIERLSSDDPTHPLRFIERCFAKHTTGAIATVIRGATSVGRRLLRDRRGTVACTVTNERLVPAIERAALAAIESGESSELACDHTDVFIEVIQPPRPVVVFGTNYDVLPLVEHAKCVGWDVTLVARREAPSTRLRFALADRVLVGSAEDIPIDRHTAVVVMTHNFETDRDILRSVLFSHAPYIGVLGPRVRTERLLVELARSGVTPTAAQLARIHAPIGLDLGSDGPSEIALSIVAEIQASLSRRSGRSLSQVNP